MAQNLGALTDTWMLNPTMFDPTQASNQFSNYNNAALPWPPSYNTGAGGPVNAATGQPIQSFQNWQQANPGGMNINATPAQPQAPAAPSNPFANVQIPQGENTAVAQPFGGLGRQQWQALTPQQRLDASGPLGQYASGIAAMPSDPFVASHNNPSGRGMMVNVGGLGFNQTAGQGAPQGGQQGGGAPPNNWQAAINALANPGKVQTMGANVPMVTGYQPSGGVNQAFLNQAGAGQGMNQGFLSALRAIQGR